METNQTQFNIFFDDDGISSKTEHSRVVDRSSNGPGPEDDASSKADFKFVNISSPSEIKWKDTRKFIRRSVARNYRQKQQLKHAIQSHSGAHSCQTADKSSGSSKNFCQVCGYSLRQKSRSRTPTESSVGLQVDQGGQRHPAIFGSEKFDPFDSFPIPEKPYIHLLIEHYLASYCPTLLPFGKWDRNTSPIVARLFRLAVQNTIYFHCILCIAAVHYDLSSNRKTFKAIACYHRGEAIKLLNSMFKDETCIASDLMVATTGALAHYDVLVGDIAALESHRMGMIAMIKMRGGIDDARLDILVKYRALWIDLLSATYTQKAPYFQTSELPSMYKGNSEVTAVLATTGFRPLLGISRPGSPLLHALRELVLLSRELQSIRQEKPSRKDIYRYTTSRSLVERGLWVVPDGGTFTDRHEKCLGFATLIYTNTVLRRLPFGSAILSHFARELRLALIEMDVSDLGNDKGELLLWLLFQGAVAAAEVELTRWYLGFLVAVCRSLQLQRWNEVLEILLKFLWVRDDILQRCKILWHEIAAQFL